MISKKVRGHKARPAIITALALIVALMQTGCGTSDKIPDVSGVKVSLQTNRFDLDLYSVDTNHIAAGLQQLYAKYPGFLNYYLDTVREYAIHGNFADTTKGIREGLRVDLTFKDFVNLEDSIKFHYPDSRETDTALLQGFRFMKYYFPGYYVPHVIYLNMGLSKWPSFPVDTTTLCVGLDMFLGDSFPYHAYVGLPDYMAIHRRESYLPVSVFSTVYKTWHPFVTEDRTLLDLMVQRGKEFYFLHKILPRTPDTVIFGYSKRQLAWCRDNEALIYNYFIHENLLYSKEMLRIMPYVNEGPFARGLESPNDTVKYSPGSIGSWLGYRIVSSWMDQHPQTTLPELVNQKTDPARMLDEARYRPK